MKSHLYLWLVAVIAAVVILLFQAPANAGVFHATTGSVVPRGESVLRGESVSHSGPVSSLPVPRPRIAVAKKAIPNVAAHSTGISPKLAYLLALLIAAVGPIVWRLVVILGLVDLVYLLLTLMILAFVIIALMRILQPFGSL